MTTLGRFFRVHSWLPWVAVAALLLFVLGGLQLLGFSIGIGSLLLGAVLAPVCLFVFMLVSEGVRP